jgi:hypothetical protein
MKTARTTLLIAGALALPYLAAGTLSGGPYAGKVLSAGFILFGICTVAAFFMWRRGRAMDSAQDERKDFILGNSMRFTFMVMAVAIQAYWSWQFALHGNAGDTSFWLLVTFWFSFVGAFVYNSVRH